MPTRPCPVRIFQAHEIHPDEDRDWTIPTDSENWGEEFRRRFVRNQMIKQDLLAGKIVQFRSSGSSLSPIVESGDSCMFEPIDWNTRLRMGWDVVFCEVQPSGRFFAHKVICYEFEYAPTAESAQVTDATHRVKYWIGNNKGHINGWCYQNHIYGRLVETVY